MTGENVNLGIYYKCLHGPNAHFALTEDHSFAVEDVLGRRWICYPLPKQAVANLELLDDLVEIDKADGKVGDSTVTDVRLIFCEDVDALRERLAEEPSA